MAEPAGAVIRVGGADELPDAVVGAVADEPSTRTCHPRVTSFGRGRSSLSPEDSRRAEVLVVNQDVGALMWRAGTEVNALSVDVPSHAGVLRVGVGAVSKRHPFRGHTERDIQKHGQVPGTGDLVAVQEEPVDYQHGPRKRGARVRVEDGVGG